MRTLSSNSAVSPRPVKRFGRRQAAPIDGFGKVRPTPVCPQECRLRPGRAAGRPGPRCAWHGQLACPGELLPPADKQAARPGPNRRSTGLTFVEMTLALVITSLVGAALATMLFASTQASHSQEAVHGATVTMERGTQRLNAAVRGSSQFLASGANFIVLWMGEKQQDGQPQLNEICRIERDANAQTLTCYLAPANLAPANNTTYTLGVTNFDTVTAALKGTANFPGTLWADQVTAWAMTFNNATPTLATLLSYKMTVTVNGVTASAVGAAALRSK